MLARSLNKIVEVEVPRSIKSDIHSHTKILLYQSLLKPRTEEQLIKYRHKSANCENTI